MTKPIINERGFGLLNLLVVLAVVFAILNVYSYFNPSFSLSKYTLPHLVSSYFDKQRIRDIDVLKTAVAAYYDKNNSVPTTDGWCGRLSDVLHPEFADQIKPFLPEGTNLPHDPINGNSGKDYFYYRVDKSRFILMAIVDLPEDRTSNPNYVYNYKNCHDWPGDNIYNYQVRNF